MKLVNKLEKTVEGWLKPAPHLPEKSRKWLADNVWWLALAGVILSILSAVSAFYRAMFADNYVDDIYRGYGISYPHSDVFGLNMSAYMLIMYVGIIASAVIMGLAINHLKIKHKKGWDLMFLALLVSIVIQVVGVLFNLSNLVGGILSVVIGAAIGSYFLFEIKPYFKAETKKAETTKEKKSE